MQVTKLSKGGATNAYEIAEAAAHRRGGDDDKETAPDVRKGRRLAGEPEITGEDTTEIDANATAILETKTDERSFIFDDQR